MSDVAISCRNVSKSFEVPHEEHVTLRGRLLHPRSSGRGTVFTALQDVDFDVRRGEFFGIVGRNGSGKSTLLKILAGIYRPDSGLVTVVGSIAPFIELGVGFNEDLSARDNVYVNGAILGMSRRMIDERLPKIVEFAELEGFMNMKLRNFSSGMLMRLAFSIAVQADADTLLVDEVLAVGDARFQRKCQDVFRERRQRGQTVIFVSHDMSAVESFCDRALLLDHGDTIALGPTATVVPEYHRLNRDGGELATEVAAESSPNFDGRPDHGVADDPCPSTAKAGSEGEAAEAEDDRPADPYVPWIRLRWTETRQRLLRMTEGEPLSIQARMHVRPVLFRPWVRVLILNEAGGVVGEARAMPDELAPHPADYTADLTIENVLTAGRYRLVGELHAELEDGQPVMADAAQLDVDVEGEHLVGSTRFRATTAMRPARVLPQGAGSHD